MKCSFCNRINDDEMAHLVAGPEGNNICDECQLNIAKEMLAKYSLLSKPVVCSFCGITDRNPHGIGTEGRVTICSRCTLIALQTIGKHGKSYQDMALELGERINRGGT